MHWAVYRSAESFELLDYLGDGRRGVDLDGRGGTQPWLHLSQVLQDEGVFFWAFAVGVVVAGADSGQQHLGRCAKQGDLVELAVELALIGLASGDEQMAVLVAG